MTGSTRRFYVTPAVGSKNIAGRPGGVGTVARHAARASASTAERGAANSGAGGNPPCRGRSGPVHRRLRRASFGAVAVGSGLSVAQTMVLSLVMFSGASQFAFVGVAAAGSPYAALTAALLLAVRNSFYGVTMSEILHTRGDTPHEPPEPPHPRGWWRLWTAHFVIDETTAMAIGRDNPRAQRYAFWATGAVLCVLWQLGSLVGALVGTSVDPPALGLDAAAPAVYLALLWPRLQRAKARAVALAGAALAVALIPVAPSGLPVVAAAGVALVVGLVPARDRQRAASGTESA
jgi:predicted branched-subunit amino acid permease